MPTGRKLPKEKRERIKKLLQDEPELSHPNLAKRFRVSTGTIYYINRELKEEQANG